MSGKQKTEGVRRIWDKYKFVALVALAPLIAIQIMGLVYAHKSKAVAAPAEPLPNEEIIELEED